MKDAFTDKGVPTKLVTDGGPQFSSREFKQFCDSWGINYEQSSPHYPQANGAAEASVKSMKHIIEKSCKGGNIGINAFREATFEFRNTPRQHGSGEAQLVFGRPMRSHAMTHYPSFKKEWQRKIEDVDIAAARLRARSKA